MLVELATLVAEAPWQLSRAHLVRAHSAGLSDDDVLQAICQAALFTHLTRIADAVDVPLDYDVAIVPPQPDRSTPPLPAATVERVGRPAIDLASRPTTARLLADWRNYIFHRDTPLTRRQRTLIARHVAAWLGDGGISTPGDMTWNPLDDALHGLVEKVTLAPWQLTDDSFAPLRKLKFDDAAIFDVCATASSAGVFSRIEVALISLACEAA